MPKRGTAGNGLAAGLLAFVALQGGVLPESAAAQGQQLSETAVKKYMDYAWSLTPQKFTKPDGKTVIIDKKKRETATIPVDTAREIIMAGRMSAYAQVCELLQDQINNYRSLMLREENKKTWNEQQMIYINQLHLTTVMLLTGKVKLVETEGDKQVVLEEKEARAKRPSDDECKKIRETIVAYVKTGPDLGQPPAGEAAPGTAAASSTAPAAPPATAAAPGTAPAATKKQ